jgi:hypothetical protein
VPLPEHDAPLFAPGRDLVDHLLADRAAGEVLLELAARRARQLTMDVTDQSFAVGVRAHGGSLPVSSIDGLIAPQTGGQGVVASGERIATQGADRCQGKGEARRGPAGLPTSNVYISFLCGCSGSSLPDCTSVSDLRSR